MASFLPGSDFMFGIYMNILSCKKILILSTFYTGVPCKHFLRRIFLLDNYVDNDEGDSGGYDDDDDDKKVGNTSVTINSSFRPGFKSCICHLPAALP